MPITLPVITEEAFTGARTKGKLAWFHHFREFLGIRLEPYIYLERSPLDRSQENCQSRFVAHAQVIRAMRSP